MKAYETLATDTFLDNSVVRASLGAMSTKKDVDTFISFLDEVFVEGRQTIHHHQQPYDEIVPNVLAPELPAAAFTAGIAEQPRQVSAAA